MSWMCVEAKGAKAFELATTVPQLIVDFDRKK